MVWLMIFLEMFVWVGHYSRRFGALSLSSLMLFCWCVLIFARHQMRSTSESLESSATNTFTTGREIASPAGMS